MSYEASRPDHQAGSPEPDHRGPSASPSASAGPSASPRPGRSRRSRLASAVASPGAIASASAVVLLALLAAAWLALVSGATVLFGGGPVVVVLLAVAGVLLLLRRGRTPGWVVLPLLALAVPAVAVGASGTRVEAQRGLAVRTPLSVADLPADGYRTGLGEQVVDLRRLEIPAGRTVDLSASSDLDRTIVALPHDRCWNVEVRWRTGDLWLPLVDEQRLVDGLREGPGALRRWSRRSRQLSYEIPARGRFAFFGRVGSTNSGRVVSRVADPGAPTLRLDLRSEGSSLVVRDYPDGISPRETPEWPLGIQPLASPSDLRERWSSPDRSRSAARAWRSYRPRQAAFAKQAATLMDGGCGRGEVSR